MAYLPNQGTNPQGELKTIPIGGVVYSTTISLAANASVNTGWIPTSGYGALLYVIRSDQLSAAGGIVIEYSNDGSTAIMGGSAGTYDDLGQLTQTALVPKAKFTRITYTNGTTAQTAFYFEVKLSTTLIQPTENSINKPVTPTNLAMVTKTVIEANNGSGVYDGIGRVGDALKVSTQIATAGVPQDVTLVANVAQTIPADATREGVIVASSNGTILVGVGFVPTATRWSYRVVTNGVVEILPPHAPLAISLISTAAATATVTKIS